MYKLHGCRQRYKYNIHTWFIGNTRFLVGNIRVKDDWQSWVSTFYFLDVQVVPKWLLERLLVRRCNFVVRLLLLLQWRQSSRDHRRADHWFLLLIDGRIFTLLLITYNQTNQKFSKFWSRTGLLSWNRYIGEVLRFLIINFIEEKIIKFQLQLYHTMQVFFLNFNHK